MLPKVKFNQPKDFYVNFSSLETLEERRILEYYPAYNFYNNFSRQRAWRHYLGNPKTNYLPILRWDKDERQDDPLAKQTVDFCSFSEGKAETYWSFDFWLPRVHRYSRDRMKARFIGEGHWLIEATSFEDENAIMFHCDVNSKEVIRYSFPDASEDLGIYETLIYYTRPTRRNTYKDVDVFVFGYLKKNKRKRKLDSSEVDGELDVSFKKYLAMNFDFILGLEIDIKRNSNIFTRAIYVCWNIQMWLVQNLIAILLR